MLKLIKGEQFKCFTHSETHRFFLTSIFFWTQNEICSLRWTRVETCETWRKSLSDSKKSLIYFIKNYEYCK